MAYSLLRFLYKDFTFDIFKKLHNLNLSVGGEACMWSIDCFVLISAVLVIHFFNELKRVIEILHQGLNFKCSFEDSVAVGGNLM